MTESVYLDNNATAPTRPEVIRAVERVMASVGNPSSVHGHGQAAKKTLEQARIDVAALCGVPAGNVIFASGGTEANNIVLRGTGRRRVLMSAVEHPSVRDAQPDATIVPVNNSGVIDLDALEEQLKIGGEDTLVSVMAANNETGVVQPISSVAALTREYGALLHCDAVQAAGKIDISADVLGADFLVVSSHKIGGTAGCGAIINVHDLPLEPLVRGGGQERKIRSGTENLVGIAGFGAAAAVVHEHGPAEMTRIAAMRDALESALASRIDGLLVAGAGAERLANTSCLMLPGVTSETQVMALDLAGVSVSAGSACSSGKVALSPVLGAMGFTDEVAASAIRVSFGWANTESDIEQFVDAYVTLYERAKERQSAA